MRHLKDFPYIVYALTVLATYFAGFFDGALFGWIGGDIYRTFPQFFRWLKSRKIFLRWLRDEGEE